MAGDKNKDPRKKRTKQKQGKVAAESRRPGVAKKSPTGPGVQPPGRKTCSNCTEAPIAGRAGDEGGNRAAVPTDPDIRWAPVERTPERRSLRIYAFDPMLARGGDHRATVEIPFRRIVRTERAFGDDRIEVIDYDGSTRSYYRAIDLEDPEIAMQDGVEPSESDPQFHQQMVYAVTSRVLENFDRALGRRLRFWGGARLRLIPHAFQGRNAYYNPQLNAVLFGYFPADEDDPGANLAGQPIFTCLSHDIVAHEVAHAALDRLRRHYREPTSLQVPALHEGFADIVAIFQRFTLTDVVRDVIRQTRGNLRRANPLQQIGAQFGAAAGLGRPLRNVSDTPDPSNFEQRSEAHDLGCELVSAVFEGFVCTYERRIADLLRISTGGSGRLPAGELHPDLVQRLTAECTATARTALAMCIRATDYLPPVDPSFSDFLRGMVTADFELNRDDPYGLRAAMIEAFRLRGIRPESVGSLAVESLLLRPLDGPARVADPELGAIVRDTLALGALEMSRNTLAAPRTAPARRVNPWPRVSEADLKDVVDEGEEPIKEWRDLAIRLGTWAKSRLVMLGLDPNVPAKLDGFHPVHRVAASGELLVEMVAQFVQTRAVDDDLGGLQYRAGLTLVATLDGRVRYAIRKPFNDVRLHALRDWVGEFDRRFAPARATGKRGSQRLLDAFSARAVDGRRWR